jgi:hypothetical protein
LQGPNKVGAMQIRRGFTRNDQNALANAGISKWIENPDTPSEFGP